MTRTAYIRRKDRIIQRYKTNSKEKLPRETTKEAWKEQQQFLKARRRARRAEKRRLVKSGIAPAARPAYGRKIDAPLPPVPERYKSYYTIFKAAGTSNPKLRSGPDPYFASDHTTVSEPPPGYISGPFAFYSTQALGLKFDGRVSLETLIERLNQYLYIFDEKRRGPKDFRAVYVRWDYRYIVVQQVLGSGDKIIEEKSDSSTKRRGKHGGRR